MSKSGKFLFLFAFLFITGLYAARLVIGGWENGMWGPLGLGLAFFLVGVYKEREALTQFFFMRTTKHGANMGALIVIALVGLACVNYLAAKYNKNFDWTTEKLNSLSDQSVKATLGLKDETSIVLLDRDDRKDENIQRSVRTLADMYQNVSKKVKYEAFNVLQRPDLAAKYDFTQGAYAVFVVQGDKKLKAEPPTEEAVTRAFIKLGRDKKKTLYFTMGHGEANIDDKTEQGLSTLKEELSVTYDVKPLILFQNENKVPDDADAVAVVRPQQQFLDNEIQALRDYARRGGHLFLALDPGTKQNLAQLTKSFGVEFQNNFILDLRARVVKGGPTMVLGTEFSKSNDITKAFRNGSSITLFYIASGLKKDTDAAASLHIEPIVSTDQNTMAVNELKSGEVRFKPSGPYTLAFAVTGALAPGNETVKGSLKSASRDSSKEAAGAKDAPKDMSALIYGDSDFVLNNFIHNNLDRDLALNSFAWLAADKDLISIRPKEPKSSKLVMTNQDFMLLFIGFLIPLPILLFFTGGFFWWRRRTA